MTEMEKALVTAGPSKLAAALAKAQGEMNNAAFNRQNPHFKSRYADLAAIRDATIPALSKYGLSISHRFVLRENNFVLVAELCHSDGEIKTSEYPLPNAPDKPQVMGSAITYAKRYTWSALCGIAADDDDDAETVERPPAAKATNGNGHKPALGAMGDVQQWKGPLKVTALKDTLKQIGRDIDACADYDELLGVINETTNKAAIDQCKVDLPSWWLGAGDSTGLQGKIEDAKDRLAAVERA